MLNKAKITKVERDLYNFCFYSFLLDNIVHNLLLVNNQFMKIERNYRHNFTTYFDKLHLVTVVWIKKNLPAKKPLNLWPLLQLFGASFCLSPPPKLTKKRGERYEALISFSQEFIERQLFGLLPKGGHQSLLIFRVKIKFKLQNVRSN